MIRLVVVDDHPVVRAGVLAVVAAEPTMEVTGEAASLAEARALLTELAPDVALVDLHLPDGDGLALVAELRDRCPRTAVLVLTMSTAPALLAGAVRSGARGYVVKGAGGPELLAAIRAVAAGGMAFGGAAATAVRALLDAPSPLPFSQLSEREREVLDEVARGASNGEIARRLGLSLKTVRNYVSTLHHKLGVADRAKLVVLGRDAGLGR